MSVVESADSKIASLASQGLFDPATLTLDEMRAVCAAALTRVADHRQPENFPPRPPSDQIAIVFAQPWFRYIAPVFAANLLFSKGDPLGPGCGLYRCNVL